MSWWIVSPVVTLLFWPALFSFPKCLWAYYSHHHLPKSRFHVTASGWPTHHSSEPRSHSKCGLQMAVKSQPDNVTDQCFTPEIHRTGRNSNPEQPNPVVTLMLWLLKLGNVGSFLGNPVSRQRFSSLPARGRWVCEEALMRVQTRRNHPLKFSLVGL